MLRIVHMNSLLSESSYAKVVLSTFIMSFEEGSTAQLKESNPSCLRTDHFNSGFVYSSNAFKNDELGRDIAIIAFPALVALTADPLASLVDTFFIGQLGLQDPTAEHHRSTAINSNKDSTDTQQKILPAVSTALIVGSILGIFELAFLTIGSGQILDLMGVSKSSNMRRPAEQYLWLRSLGSPAVVLSLVVQGVFRGFKDTQTPLFATAFGNVVNMILVPIFMFTFGYGVSGSAVATVLSQYLIALILLMKLCRKVVLFAPKLGGLPFGLFIKNGGLLLARSAAVMLSLTLATSLAARQGAIPMAAHQICMQVWLATSLLSDAIALAGQAIIASGLAKGDFDMAKAAAFRTLQIGFAFGLMLSIILGAGLSTFSKLFTSDRRVHEFLAIGIPFVAATQPVNSVAFVFDGLHFGASDFIYAAYSMIIVAVLTSAFMLVAASMWGFTGVWLGLTVLMTFRMLTGFLRVGTASGPWKFLKSFQKI
ncbi:hypothetical protein L7F22_026286 [Adiantum nelumboides]|nr:hypothetical protein [Adiantum nelumboides]